MEDLARWPKFMFCHAFTTACFPLDMAKKLACVSNTLELTSEHNLDWVLCNLRVALQQPLHCTRFNTFARILQDIG